MINNYSGVNHTLKAQNVLAVYRHIHEIRWKQIYPFSIVLTSVMLHEYHQLERKALKWKYSLLPVDTDC